MNKKQREFWQDLVDAIKPVLEKYDTGGSNAGNFDLPGALAKEVEKAHWIK